MDTKRLQALRDVRKKNEARMRELLDMTSRNHFTSYANLSKSEKTLDTAREKCSDSCCIS